MASKKYGLQQGCSSIPTLSELILHLDNLTAKKLNEAEFAIRDFAQVQLEPLRTKAFSDSCFHMEALANVKISGRQVYTRDVFENLALKQMRPASKTQKNTEALRNTSSLKKACELGGGPVTISTFCEIHKQLLTGTTRESYRGSFRENTKTIGASRYQTLETPIHPPESEHIDLLLKDLAVFCNQSTLPAVAQAAIAHVQFVAIHPFLRANGKTARSIIQLVFQRRGLIDCTVIPLSISLCTSPHKYQTAMVSVLESFHRGDLDSGRMYAWLNYFCDCCLDAVKEAASFQNRALALQETWLTHLESRSDSASTLIIHALPGMPAFTASSAAIYIDRSFKRVSSSIHDLCSAGIIEQITTGNRNRAFACPAIIEAYSRIKGFQ